MPGKTSDAVLGRRRSPRQNFRRRACVPMGASAILARASTFLAIAPADLAGRPTTPWGPVSRSGERIASAWYRPRSLSGRVASGEDAVGSSPELPNDARTRGGKRFRARVGGDSATASGRRYGSRDARPLPGGHSEPRGSWHAGGGCRLGRHCADGASWPSTHSGHDPHPAPRARLRACALRGIHGARPPASLTAHLVRARQPPPAG